MDNDGGSVRRHLSSRHGQWWRQHMPPSIISVHFKSDPSRAWTMMEAAYAVIYHQCTLWEWSQPGMDNDGGSVHCHLSSVYTLRVIQGGHGQWWRQRTPSSIISVHFKSDPSRHGQWWRQRAPSSIISVHFKSDPSRHGQWWRQRTPSIISVHFEGDPSRAWTMMETAYAVIYHQCTL